MVTKYIKSIGGCSAQPLSDQKAAKTRLGNMRLEQPAFVKLGEPSQFTFVLNHPNNSGLQFDQITRNYIPAYYVTRAEITFNGVPVLRVEPNISVAEDPTFTFWYVVEKAGDMRVLLEDSTHALFSSSYRVVPGPGI
jgi:sulfur-oxidizing protein SoxY